MRHLVIALLITVSAGIARADEPPTEVQEPLFKLSLPGRWREVPAAEDGLWQYRHAGIEAQVSVSIATSEPHFARDELAKVFSEFEAARRRAVGEQSPGCELSAVEKREHLDAIAGSYLGHCLPDGPRIGDLMVSRTDLVASFLVEAYGLSEEEFRELFHAVVRGSGLAREE